MKELIAIPKALESAVHFGHQTKRWNPKMAPYIYGKKEGIHIIDLTKTIEKLQEAYDFVKGLAREEKSFLFVGTKKQAQEVILELTKDKGLHYVEKWVGGMLTNFNMVRKSINRLRELEKMEEEEKFNSLPKKETMKLKKEKMKLQKNLSGIKNMEKLPDCLIVVDTSREKIAVSEAKKLRIPIVGIIDTNCDPDDADYPIPANDDTIKSIRLIISCLIDGILEGKKETIQPLEIQKEKKEEEMEEKNE